jgi:hypothetical protein
MKMSKILLIFAYVIMLMSCSPQRKLRGTETIDIEKPGNWRVYCDSLQAFESLYINRVNADIYIGQETYHTRITLYYLPDSLFLVSAVHAGFEMVRIGITKDSTVYINRIDKVAYIYKIDPRGNPPPMEFKDLEYLVNKHKICGESGPIMAEDNTVIVDRSLKDVAKVITFSDRFLSISSFEFFHKRTGEYIVGEQSNGKKLTLYSNYIVRDLKIEAYGGQVEFNRKMNVDLTINRNKYNIIYL